MSSNSPTHGQEADCQAAAGAGATSVQPEGQPAETGSDKPEPVSDRNETTVNGDAESPESAAENNDDASPPDAALVAGDNEDTLVEAGDDGGTKVDAPRRNLHRVRPLLALVHDGVDATCHLIEEGNDSVGRAVTAMNESVVLAAAPQLYLPVQGLNALRRGITWGILGCVRGVNRGVQSVSDVALNNLTSLPPATTIPGETSADLGDDEPVQQQSGAVRSLHGGIDQGVGILNGIIGDYLEARGNGLAMSMALRCGNVWLPALVTTDAIKSAVTSLQGATEATKKVAGPFPRKIVVLVHGLTATELSWSVGADSGLGSPDAHYGSLLHAATGHVPLYLRYNSGLPIKDNGEKLNELLEALLLAWPQRETSSSDDGDDSTAADHDRDGAGNGSIGGGVELVLVGHSMGGLVIRAAGTIAAATGASWVKALRLVACLGSPHKGAPFARFGESAVQMCNSVDLPATQIIGSIGDFRSQGIKDLCDGAQAATGALLPSPVQYFFAAGTIAPTAEMADYPIIETLGDMMVPPSSAEGPGLAAAAALANKNDDRDETDGDTLPQIITVKRFPGVSHVGLQVNRDVYVELEAAVRKSSL